MTEHDLPPAAANAIVGALTAEAKRLPPPTPEQAEERERAAVEQSRAIFTEGSIRDAVARWEDACPRALQTSDWAFAKLQPCRGSIDRILKYQLGPKGLLASGPTGRGKSRAMWQRMRGFCDVGLDVRFYTAFDWFSTLQQQVQYGRDEARGWVEAVARRRIVFIDDIGQQTVQRSREEWAASWFFRFLDIRVGEGLPLFVTTNLTAGEMAGRAGDVRGDPMVRRILDVCDPVTF